MGYQFQFCGDIQELLLPLHLVQGLVLYINFYREFFAIVLYPVFSPIQFLS